MKTMNREIDIHNESVNEPSEIEITVLDNPPEGLANNFYLIRGFNTDLNLSSTDMQGYRSSYSCLPIIFQNGDQRQGANGVTMESLLVVCIDRLQQFQKGTFACEHNEKALEHLNQALSHLKDRSNERTK